MASKYRPTNYSAPAFAAIRLEAIWTVRFSFARGATKAIAKILKDLDTIKRKSYLPPQITPIAKPGHLLELVSLSIDHDLDKPEAGLYPDW
jgi:hypothetical protein